MAKKTTRARRAQTFIQRSRGVSPAEKARFHQIDGAGRARVTRPFLGLTPDEEAEIEGRITAFIDQRLRRP